MLSHSIFINKNAEEWVTFIHGAGGSSSIWFRQIKEFHKEYNVLLIDLRGHGANKSVLKDAFNTRYTFDVITNDIIEVLTHLKINKSHFAGISLGTILIRSLAEKRPEMVQSMIMGGAILKLNIRSKILLGLGNVFKSVVPYMFIYKLFAFIIMPKQNHKESRLLFIREAKKLCQKEFMRWYKLTSEINPLLRLFRDKDIGIPTLYVMGDQDHLFLPSIKRIVGKYLNTELHVIKDCGHVVNVDAPEKFNINSLNFLRSLA